MRDINANNVKFADVKAAAVVTAMKFYERYRQLGDDEAKAIKKAAARAASVEGFTQAEMAKGIVTSLTQVSVL